MTGNNMQQVNSSILVQQSSTTNTGSSDLRIRNCLYFLIAIALIFRFFYPFFSHPFDHLYSDPDRHYTNISEANFGKSIYSILDLSIWVY
jgi:hypothetical protein